MHHSQQQHEHEPTSVRPSFLGQSRGGRGSSPKSSSFAGPLTGGGNLIRLGPSLEKLNGHNYRTWRQAMKQLLIDNNLFQALSRNDSATWRQDRARLLIKQNIERPIWSRVDKCSTVADLWRKLELMHSYTRAASLPDAPAIINSLYKFHIRKACDAETGLQRIRRHFQDLAKLGWSLKEPLAAELILNALPASFESLKEQWRSLPKEQRLISNLENRIKDLKVRAMDLERPPRMCPPAPTSSPKEPNTPSNDCFNDPGLDTWD